MNKLLLYTNSLNPKLRYVFDFFCFTFLGCDYEITDDKNYFLEKSDVLKLSYSSDAIEDIITVSNSYYFRNFKIDFIPEFEEEFVIENDQCNFDVFAASFYLLTRVEEYGDFVKDKHGRYSSENSILVKRKLINKPIIDYWFIDLKKALEQKYNVALGVNGKYKFKSTVDIDHIYAYAEKPMFVQFGSCIKDFLTFKFERLKDRFWGNEPYNTYGMIHHLNNQEGHKIHSFILTSERGRFDKSFPSGHPAFIKRSKEMSKYGEVGIHPSYASDSMRDKITIEKTQLENVIDRSITSSRQHFVKLEFPRTYRSLIECGIVNDYSMGYPDCSGFRAGTSMSFKWYDLAKDCSTDLRIHSFQLMDVTLKNYENLNAKQAIEKASQIIMHCRKVKGTACLIWHNSSFYSTEGWAGWKEVYEKILSMANLKNNNTLD